MKKTGKKLNRRQFIKKATLAAGSAALFQSPVSRLGSAVARAAAPLQVRIGIDTSCPCCLSVLHAFQAGLYREYGLDAHIEDPGGSKAMSGHIVAKRIHAAQLKIPVFLKMNADPGKDGRDRIALVTAQTVGRTVGKELAVYDRKGTSSGEPVLQEPCCVLAASREMCLKDPELTRALFNASQKSAMMLGDLSYRKAQIASLPRTAGIDMRSLKSMLESTALSEQTTFEPQLDTATVLALVNKMQAAGNLPGSIDARQLAAGCFIPEWSV